MYAIMVQCYNRNNEIYPLSTLLFQHPSLSPELLYAQDPLTRTICLFNLVPLPIPYPHPHPSFHGVYPQQLS
jgi:hypothetical protein